MKTRKLGTGTGLGRRSLAVESLERRSMLAGNVSVSVTGGSLFVRGDDKDNAVLIEQVGNGEYAVSGFDFADAGISGYQSGPTKINGAANGTVVVSGVTGDIHVDLRKGNDGLGIGNSVDDLLALAEECGFGLGIGEGSGSGSGSGSEEAFTIAAAQHVEDQFFAPRNLIVNTGDGNDGVAISASVAGVLSVSTGNGNDGVVVGGSFSLESEAHIGDDLIILTGGGHDHACVDFVTVHDHLNVQTGEGNDGVELFGFDAGHVLVTTGNGNDFVDLDGFDTDREIVVDTGAGHDSARLDDFSAGQGFGPQEQEGNGFVTVVTGAGNDEVKLEDFDANGVTVDTGAGNDGSPSAESPITIEDAFITGHLTVVTGAGNDYVLVEFVEAGNVTIDTGAGHDGSSSFPVEIYNVFFENLTVVTGEGNDYVYIHAGNGEDTSIIENNLVVNTSGGNDIVQVIEQLIGNDLVVSLGAGNDAAAIGIDDGIGEGVVDSGLTVKHNLVVDAGAGNDGVGVGNVDVLNDVFAFLGAGNDFLSVFGLDAGGNALIDAGAGNDFVELDNSFVEGDVKILLGSGNDTLDIFGSNGNGKLRLYGGSGKDTLNSDLGIEANGIDGPVEVYEFEIFNFTE